jgi:hypothetical protein
MPNGDPAVCGLPCRFPARSSMLGERRAQVYGITIFFGYGRATKIFFSEFSRAAGKRERRRYPAGFGSFFGAAATSGSHSPITPHIVAV